MHGYPEDLDPAWTHILHQEVLFPKIWGPVQKKSILLGFHNAWWRNPLPKKIHAQASESGTYPSMGWGLIKKVEIGYKHLKLLNPAIPPLNRTTRKHRLTQYCIAKIRDIGCLMCQILSEGTTEDLMYSRTPRTWVLLNLRPWGERLKLWKRSSRSFFLVWGWVINLIR